MQALLAVSLAAALMTPMTLQVEVERERGALKMHFDLVDGLPASFEEALPSGAHVRVTYEVRVRAQRRYWWSRRIWSGTAVSQVAFDPVTGRYLCELILDDVIVASLETEQAARARRWLISPPPVRVMLPPSRRALRLRIRSRAIFSSTTTWLIFPTAEGTDWVEVRLEAEP
jgi:hypothetical protein